MKTIDTSEPKRMYWNDDADPSHGCPECKKELVIEEQSYLLGIAQKTELLPFVIKNDGHFCPACLVVVFDREKFTAMAKTASGVDKPVYAVAGIIDEDAVPEDKRGLPYSDDNKMPLVAFLPPKDKKSGDAGKKKQTEMNPVHAGAGKNIRNAACNKKRQGTCPCQTQR